MTGRSWGERTTSSSDGQRFQAGGLSKLASYPRRNGTAWALKEIGKIERTLFALEWLESPILRRRVTAGLNKGEAAVSGTFRGLRAFLNLGYLVSH